jgi:hypothetical protein
MNGRAVILLVLVLLGIVGCGESEPPAPPMRFEEFTIGMSLEQIDAGLRDRKWIRTGTTTYASVVRYDLQLLGERPPHLGSIRRVELTTVDSMLVGIDVVNSSESFSSLKTYMKAMDENLTLTYGEPHREKRIDDLVRTEISGPEPVTVAVWRVDPPRRIVAMAFHETPGGNSTGLVHFAYLDEDL